MKFQFNKLMAVFMISGSLFIQSCSKDDPAPSPVTSAAKGLYVLSEGGGDSKLGYYNKTTGAFLGDFFYQQNGNNLGQIGNDMIQYGGKSYIVMNTTGNVTVIDHSTGLLLRRINFVNVVPGRLPRYAIAHQGKVFVSAQDGTVSVIDTASLDITRTITVGANPEEMAISGDKLFVTNSGGFNFPDYDSTLSVINLNTLVETGKIRVGINPQKITADENGNLYIVATGDYATVPSSIVKVNAATETVIFRADTAVSTIRYYDNALFVTNDFPYTGLSSNVRMLRTSDFSNRSTSFISDATAIATPYGLDIDENNGDVYITDAKDFVVSGEVFCFDKLGKKRFSFSVSPGVNPNSVVFIR
jgi:YVTN family beta-propeller protein